MAHLILATNSIDSSLAGSLPTSCLQRVSACAPRSRLPFRSTQLHVLAVLFQTFSLTNFLVGPIPCQQHYMEHNEYIVYNTNQAQIKYLVRMKLGQ